MFEVRVQAGPFDLAAEHARLAALPSGPGAISSFVGLVRDAPLLLEHYPAMAEREMATILDEARARWPLFGAIVVHRHGLLAPAEPIVLVLTAARHRAAAIDSAAFLMDYLKTRAPFWKKEAGGWVEAHAADDAAAERWE
jgi:molybdopterin synthase catalytic subunit